MECVGDLKQRIDELAELMDEFGLDKARLRGEDWSIEFSRLAESGSVVPVALQDEGEIVMAKPRSHRRREPAAEPAVDWGTPLTSPMTGIFFSSPNPSSPPYVSEGQAVVAGQVVGLIEAMKVFNELTASVSGTISRIAVSNGQVVQPGEPILYVR